MSGVTGPGAAPTIPHLTSIDATLKVASTEHLGLDLIPIEVRAVADIIADYGHSGLLEYSSLVAWGLCRQGWQELGSMDNPPFPPVITPGSSVSQWPRAKRHSTCQTALSQPMSE